MIEIELERRRPAAIRAERVRRALSPAHLALAAILALSLVLNVHKLGQNAWANTFYSASVRSMLGSLHNFFFVSFDQGGLVTIDKPPLGVWPQVLSAKLFGFQPLSLLLPEAILGTLTVAVLYAVIARRLGQLAALAAALSLAAFPIFVAVSRDNGVDPLLIVLSLLACACALRAIERDRIAWLLGSAALIGLAFNTKTLAAYLVVPGIALGWLVCAPSSLLRRLLALVGGGVVLVVVSFAWIAAVELTPASERPYVGSSTNDTELGLTFEYNGFGRVEGEVGGPGNIPARAGGLVVPPPSARRSRPALSAGGQTGARKRAQSKQKQAVRPAKYLPNGRYRYPIAFGGAVGPLRLFDAELDGQGAWTLPLAIFGLIALALQALGLPRRRLQGQQGLARRRRRSDPQLAILIVLGGWFVVEFLVLSYSKGIVHPYYVSALAPPDAAMIGAGVGACASFARSTADRDPAQRARRDSRFVRDPRLLLLVPAVAATVAAQIAIIDQQSYLQWFVPFLVVGAALATALLVVRRLSLPALVALLAILTVAPVAYAATTWLAPVEGTFPAAGPHETAGVGLYDVEPKPLRETRNLVAYAATHHAAGRWSLLTDSSPTAAPMILLGSHVGAVGGYGGTDPVLDGRALARLIARGQARYVVIGGQYAERGGNKATAAVIHDCPQVPHGAWHGPVPGPTVLVLFDCAGRERALEAHPAG
ncbi:MAG TPA: glycosyltransferase family 39 protein [Solirubrobacteraceae bacterium]|jgi:4-amino-4-deoxy-L-arabinose transferase-like glycosyltransferase|nr:glycosyltransferase family 39 protein [Solirubrobacteraceae bacterium]